MRFCFDWTPSFTPSFGEFLIKSNALLFLIFYFWGMYNYTAFGLQILSKPGLPGLLACNGLGEVTIRFGEVPENLFEPIVGKGVAYELNVDSFLLKVPEVARSLVTNGNEIVIEKQIGQMIQTLQYLLSIPPLVLFFINEDICRFMRVLLRLMAAVRYMLASRVLAYLRSSSLFISMVIMYLPTKIAPFPSLKKGSLMFKRVLYMLTFDGIYSIIWEKSE